MGVTRELSPYFDNEFVLAQEKHDEFNAAIGPLVEFIKNFRKYFRSFFGELDQLNHKINISFFSDGFYVGVPLGEEMYSSNDHSPIILGISYLLKTCGLIFLMSLFFERLLRAGIDIGGGVELKNDEIFGPALIKAYKLEKKAKYPRIIIGDSLIEYLETQKAGNISTYNQSVEDIQRCQRIAAGCLDLIENDKNFVENEKDSFYILDYLNEEFIKMWRKTEKFDSSLNFDEIIKSSFQYVEQSLNQVQSDPDLKKKYKYLLEYMQQRIISANIII
jgi:hypothetical protein